MQYAIPMKPRVLGARLFTIAALTDIDRLVSAYFSDLHVV